MPPGGLGALSNEPGFDDVCQILDCSKVETLVVVEVAAEGGLPAKFPSDFKWQKLALSAPLKPRKVAMHPRFTTPERLTPSYALVGGRGGEKILRY